MIIGRGPLNPIFNPCLNGNPDSVCPPEMQYSQEISEYSEKIISAKENVLKINDIIGKEMNFLENFISILLKNFTNTNNIKQIIKILYYHNII